MIVVITTWLPRRACSQPGTNAQAAPQAAATTTAAGMTSAVGQPPAPRQRSATPRPADVRLALGADVEEPAVEGDGDGQAR